MKKLRILVPGLLLVVGFGLLFSLNLLLSNTRASGKIQLGAIFSMRGLKSDMGIPSSGGARLAVAELNKRGGVLGQPLELLLKDGESDTLVVKEKVREILEEAPETIAFLGLCDTDLAYSAAMEAKHKNRVFLTSGATSPLLPTQIPDYLYMACFGDNVQSAAAAEFAFYKLDAYTVSIVYDSSETYTRLLQQYFIDRFQSLGGKIIEVLAYDPADMNSLNLKAPDADLVFFSAGSVQDAVAGIRKMRATGITVPIVGGDSYDSEDVWEANPDIQDVFYTTHVYLGPDNTNDQVTNFRNAYQAAYGGYLPDAFAALGYDAVNLLAIAITQAGSTDPDEVRKSLAMIKNFQGVTGTISFANGSPIPQKSVSIIKVVEGTRTLEQQLMPTMVPEAVNR